MTNPVRSRTSARFEAEVQQHFTNTVASLVGIDNPQSAEQVLAAVDAKLATKTPTPAAAQLSAEDALYAAAWGSSAADPANIADVLSDDDLEKLAGWS